MPKPLPEAEDWMARVRFTANLVGEGTPVYCSLCMGSRYTRGLFGPKRCIQCEGVGVEGVGPHTMKWIKSELE